MTLVEHLADQIHHAGMQPDPLVFIDGGEIAIRKKSVESLDQLFEPVPRESLALDAQELSQLCQVARHLGDYVWKGTNPLFDDRTLFRAQSVILPRTGHLPFPPPPPITP